MTRPARLSLVLLCVAVPSPAQERTPAEQYARAVKGEDELARKLGERIAKPGESERERWFKRLDEVYTGRVPPDPADWFALVVPGQAEWKRDGSKYFAEFHERILYRLDLDKNTAVTRDTFATYAARFLGAESPPWKLVDVDAEGKEAFRRFDLDKDGGLSKAECSPALQERFAEADADRSERITADEYRDFFRLRVGSEVRFPSPPPEDKGKGERREEPKPPAEDRDEPRPVVIRDVTQLPKEVPGWFRELDADRDLQVALYEWHAAKRAIPDFQAMDLNGDGLLEASEYLRFVKTQASAKPTDLRAAVPDGRKR